MAPATRTQAETCDPNSLDALISEWQTAHDSVEASLDKADNSFKGSVPYWEGKTADRARDTADQAVIAGRRFVDDLFVSVLALKKDRDDIWAVKNRGVQAIMAAVNAKFDVNEDGTVIPSKAAELAAVASTTEVKQQTSAIAALRKYGKDVFEPPIKAALSDLGAAVQTATDHIAKAFEHSGGVSTIAVEAPGKLDPSKQLTAEQGKADGETIADGKLSAEEKQRILDNLRNANLTPEQLNAIKNGQEVTVPASTMAYLENLYGRAGFNGLTELSSSLKSDPSPEGQALRRELSSGMLALSNERVTSRNVDGAVNNRGGFDKLDPKVQFMTGTRFAGPDANTRNYPDGYRDNFNDDPGVAHEPYYRDMNRFSDFLSASNPDHTPGDRFGVELGRQAAHQAWIADHGTGIYGDSARPRVGDSDQSGLQPWVKDSDPAATQFLGVSSRNQDSSFALLTGTGSEELFGKGTPGQEWHAYDRSSTVGTLMTHNWTDDGAALEETVRWPGDQAYDADPARAARAGEAAHSLAEIMSTTKSGNGTNIYESLLDMPGQDRKSFAEVNPLAAQGIATALAPYTADMVGTPAQFTGTHGFTPDLGPVESARIFSVLDGDPQASALINGAALARAEQIDRYFATEAAMPNDQEPLELGRYSGRLRGLVDAGLAAHVADLNLGETEAAKEKSDQRSAAYGVMQNLIGLSGSAGPQAAIAGPMLQALVEIPKNPLTGVDPDYSGHTPQTRIDSTPYDFARSGTDGDRRYNMFSQLIESGRINPWTLPDELQQTIMISPDDGTSKMKPYLDAANTDQAADTLDRHLPDVLSQNGISRDDQIDYLRNGDQGRNSFTRIISNGIIDAQHELRNLRSDELEQRGLNEWLR